MPTASAEPITSETINQFVSQLTDEQKRYVLSKLLPSFLASLPGLTAIYDDRGRLVGDLVPIRPVPPGTKVGMTDEERAAMAGVTFVKREEPEVWRVQLAKKRGETGDGRQ